MYLLDRGIQPQSHGPTKQSTPEWLANAIEAAEWAIWLNGTCSLSYAPNRQSTGIAKGLFEYYLRVLRLFLAPSMLFMLQGGRRPPSAVTL